MSNPFPESVRAEAWNLLRPYAELRLRVKDIIPLPIIAIPLIGNWSVKVGAILERLFGSDRRG